MKFADGTLNHYTFCSWRFEGHILVITTHLLSNNVYMSELVLFTNPLLLIQVKTLLPVTVEAEGYPKFNFKNWTREPNTLFFFHITI